MEDINKLLNGFVKTESKKNYKISESLYMDNSDINMKSFYINKKSYSYLYSCNLRIEKFLNNEIESNEKIRFEVNYRNVHMLHSELKKNLLKLINSNPSKQDISNLTYNMFEDDSIFKQKNNTDDLASILDPFIIKEKKIVFVFENDINATTQKESQKQTTQKESQKQTTQKTESQTQTTQKTEFKSDKDYYRHVDNMLNKKRIHIYEYESNCFNKLMKLMRIEDRLSIGINNIDNDQIVELICIIETLIKKIKKLNSNMFVNTLSGLSMRLRELHNREY